jgi:hypothetical protein
MPGNENSGFLAEEIDEFVEKELRATAANTFVILLNVSGGYEDLDKRFDKAIAGAAHISAGNMPRK